MGSSADYRSKRRDIIWKKAIIHFSLCFSMGFLFGLAPTTKSTTYQSIISQDILVQSTTSADRDPIDFNTATTTTESTKPAEASLNSTEIGGYEYGTPLILVTVTSSIDPFKRTFLRRLSDTLKHVPAPLLWIIVEDREEAGATAEMLRMTGIMYRHLTFNENFTDAETEIDYQRNLALKHIEYHRLDGIVHFADLDNVYELTFFDEIRDIETFGTWVVASVWANRMRVAIEGPVCADSEVLGWSFNHPGGGGDSTMKLTSRSSVSGFGFKSNILWDPERWGRRGSEEESMVSVNFVRQVVLEDESKLMAFPSDCSRIMVWNLHVPRNLFLGADYQTSGSDINKTHVGLASMGMLGREHN